MYICIDKHNLNVEIINKRSRKRYIVPTTIEKIFRDLSPIEHVLYYKVLYPLYTEEYNRKHPDQAGQVAFKLAEPEPWMISMALIMWQGIIQGLAWDAVKLLVNNALAKLASFDLAPVKKNIKKSTTKKSSKQSQLGFAWIKYGTDGKKQHDIFIGLKRVYDKMSEKQREDVSNSIIKTKKKT